MPARKALKGIFYILRTGCQWKALPREYVSGSTVHRTFQKWRAAGTLKKSGPRDWKSNQRKKTSEVMIHSIAVFMNLRKKLWLFALFFSWLRVAILNWLEIADFLHAWKLAIVQETLKRGCLTKREPLWRR